MDTQELREREQLSTGHSPFKESAATTRFFSGGMRQKVLDEMVSALAGGIPIVTLTGEEGSGKTVLCRMLEDRMNSGYTTVYFPRATDSFEDVLKAIVQKLGIISDPVPKNRTELLQSIVSNLHDRNLRALLIFDEAERIYLATLERVRKMLDLANHTGVLIQMVMSGRSGLHHNFRNLALCNFQPAEEKHFSLEPLTEDETIEYLTFIMDHAVPEKKSFFSRKTAASIFASSRGNLRMINHLADELLRRDEGREQLSPVVDDGQEKKIRRDKPHRRRLKRPAVALPKFALNWRYISWGGGAVCIVLAFLLFRPEEKTVGPQVEAIQDPETSIVISQPKEMERVAPNAEAIDQNGPEKQEKEEAPVVHLGESKPREQPANPTPAPEVAEQEPAGIPDPAEPVGVSSPQQSETPSAGTGFQAEEQQQPIVQQAIPASDIAETEKVASSAPIAPTVVSSPEQLETPVAGSGSEAEDKQPLAVSIEDIPEQESKKEEKQSASSVEASRRPESAAETAAAERIAVETAAQSGPTRQDVAVVTEAGQPAAATEEAPIAPPIIKARGVIKHREVLAGANRGSITSERAKILKQEEESDAFDLPAAPITIRAVEQKKESELAPRPTPSTGQGRQAAEPEKAAAAVSENPKRTDSVDKIYTSRVAAGASWLSGLKDDRYTVRLMVITSGDAEKKLKTMLGEKNYREQADKFYILRRESNPGVQYVYYGEYPTMTAARNARNTIPEFLRGYKPYAMSVKGAVQRVQQED